MTGIIEQNVGRTSGLIKAAGGGGGVWTLIKTLTASGDGTLIFTDNSGGVVLDSTYPIYVFKFINIHPSNNSPEFQFNMSIDAGSNYNVTKTSTSFLAYLNEGDTDNALAYDSGKDLAQGTGFQTISAGGVGNGNDESLSGSMYLFNPSSTTFVKHFMSTMQFYMAADYTHNSYVTGYGNTTSAVDSVQFKFGAGNIDLGKIKLYGIKDSA